MRARQFTTTGCQGQAELLRMLSAFTLKKSGLFFGRIRLSPANAAKIILAACVLHSNLRNDISTKDNVTENTDAPSQSQHFTVPE
jgi:hypothetical protein